MLHKRIDSLEAAAASDEFTRFDSHEETVERIRSAPPGNYSLLLIGCRGLRRAEVQYGKAVGDELAGAFATLNPGRFGDAEEEYFAAQQAYRDLLHEITGADPDGILRRLAR